MRHTGNRENPAIKILGSIVLTLLAIAPALGQKLPASPAVSSTSGHPVLGVVLDPSGAIIADARVIIRHATHQTEQAATTDHRGEFRFAHVGSGEYEIVVQKEGFKATVTRIAVGAKSPSPLHVTLPIADVHEEIAVTDRGNQVTVNPDENLNVLKLDRQELKNLPVLGNDVIGSVARLMDAGSVGAGGPTIIIDGLESSKRKVPASQIQEVRINQNPYSAEFSRPGRGRIEVITKAGAPEYHGEMNFIFRDDYLNARNAFALDKPPEQRRIYEGNLTGPIGNGKKTSFLFGVQREEEDLQSVVFAETPAGVVSENVANPARDTEISFRFNHEVSKKTTFSIRYEYTFDSTRNEGVGGFNLPEVAANSRGREHQLYFTHRRIISLGLINEFTMRVERESAATLGVRSEVPQIVVLDAFTGGGSQVDRRSTATNLQLNEIISWNHGKHFIRAGLNLPNINRLQSNDRTNFNGTFTFSTLADYENNQPFLYSVNQGDGRLNYWRKEMGLFIQDNILLRRNLSVAAGLRYDRQNYLEDGNNLAPRVSFAWAPDKAQKTVLRGGAGIFYDRTGSGPIGDTLRFDGQRVRQVTLSDPGYPDPLADGGSLAEQPAGIVRFAPDLHSPYVVQLSMGVERQLTKSLIATATYIHTHGIKLFRSRNLNAPLPPYIETPDPSIGVLREIESSAQSRAHSLELMMRGKVGRFFNGTVQYTLGRANNNASGINSLPADNYDLTREWSRAEFDERHRFTVLGSFEAGDWFNLGLTLQLTSGRPYSLTTGRDDNRDSNATDRPPGVYRNSLQGPGAATLDMRWSKEFSLSKKEEGPTFTVGVDAFNVLNRTNFTGYVGNLSSPFFGLPVASRAARQFQLTLGFQF